MDQSQRNAAFQSPAVAAFWKALQGNVDRLVGTLDGMSQEQLNWHPQAQETNSLFVLATHTLGNIAESVLELFGDQPVHRDRDAEFRASGASANALTQRWNELQAQAQPILAGITDADLARGYEHPRRGKQNGYQLMFLIACHAAEHAGQAELTRDMIRAQ